MLSFKNIVIAALVGAVIFGPIGAKAGVALVVVLGLSGYTLTKTKR